MNLETSWHIAVIHEEKIARHSQPCAQAKVKSIEQLKARLNTDPRFHRDISPIQNPKCICFIYEISSFFFSSRHVPISYEMHHLHPRSRSTSTLFTTTLAISFLVVSLPHLLPCPVDRRQFADTIEMPDGSIRRRRKRVDRETEAQDESAGEHETAQIVATDARPKRECPVPKPGGVVGQVLGFEQRKREELAEIVVVKELRKRRVKPTRNGDESVE